MCVCVLSVCVWMCVHTRVSVCSVWGCECACTRVSVCWVCAGEELEASIAYPTLKVLYCLEFLGSSCCCLPSASITGTHCNTQLFTCVLGIRTYMFLLAKQALNHEPRPGPSLPKLLLWPTESVEVFFVADTGKSVICEYCQFFNFIDFWKEWVLCFIYFFLFLNFHWFFPHLRFIILYFAFLLCVYSAFVFQDSWGSSGCWLETVHLFMHACSVIHFLSHSWLCPHILRPRVFTFLTSVCLFSFLLDLPFCPVGHSEVKCWSVSRCWGFFLYVSYWFTWDWFTFTWLHVQSHVTESCVSVLVRRLVL